jgi:small subunit ribosomal protein S21
MHACHGFARIRVRDFPFALRLWYQRASLDAFTRLEQGAQIPVHVIVRDNNVDQALKALKKKMQREGIFREMKRRRSYEKPSEKRAREKAEAVRRARKLERKRLEREGF